MKAPRAQEENAKQIPVFFLPQILFFLWLKTPCKFSEPYDNSFWEKGNNLGEKEIREKNAVNSNHLVSWKRTQAARANYYREVWKASKNPPRAQ